MTKNEIYWEISVLKNNLKATDYKAIKYAEGAMTEEEFATDKVNRAEWRAQINTYQEMIENGDFNEPEEIIDEYVEESSDGYLDADNLDSVDTDSDNDGE